MVGAVLCSVLFIKIAFVSVCPQQEPRDPRRSPSHKLADIIQGYLRRSFDDHLIVYMSDDPIIPQRVHGIGQNITADSLDDVLGELGTVTLDPAPFLLGIGSHIGDGFAAELVFTDPGLNVGQAPPRRKLNEQHT